MTDAEARFNNSLRTRKPEGSLGRVYSTYRMARRGRCGSPPLQWRHLRKAQSGLRRTSYRTHASDRACPHHTWWCTGSKLSRGTNRRELGARTSIVNINRRRKKDKRFTQQRIYQRFYSTVCTRVSVSTTGGAILHEVL